MQRTDRRFTLRWAERLHSQSDFQRVLKSGRRLVHPALFIYTQVWPRDVSLRRMGLVTGRKVGNAVTRNRVKRLLREVFRLNKHRLLPGVDVVFVSRPAAAKYDFYQLEAAVLKQWQAAGVCGPESVDGAEPVA